jgi:hypothetical protein
MPRPAEVLILAENKRDLLLHMTITEFAAVKLHLESAGLLHSIQKGERYMLASFDREIAFSNN